MTEKQDYFNFGNLRGKVPFEKNIVYYRRGLDEFSLNITNACPNDCRFCIRNTNRGWGVSNLYLTEDPSIEEILNAIDFATQRIRDCGERLRKVKICGYGEPLLRFNDLFPIIERIKQNHDNVQVQLTTTGWPYFKYVSSEGERLRDISKAGLTEVYLSLNTLDRAKYIGLVRPGIDDLRVTAFDEAIKFGVLAKEAGLVVTVGFIGIAGLEEDKVERFASEFGFKYKIRRLERWEHT